MKILQITTLLIAFIGCSWVNAQDAPKANVKKELAQVMKDLPQDVQLQILEFAQRKSEAWELSQAAMAPAAPAVVEAPKPAPQQAMAKPQPAAPVATPQPAVVQQAATVQVNPAAASQLTSPDAQATQPAQAAPAQPARPEWMTEAEGMKPTTATWSETDHDFGVVEEGPTVSHTFKFKNTGSVPLKLTYVKASCGCTTPKWSTEEVAPGAEGIIEVAFNTRGRVGIQQKSVTVAGNFEGNTIQVLRFKCEVKAAAAAGGK